MSYNREQLKAAFETVQDKKHWKNPIDAVVNNDRTTDLDLIRDAIIYFTATVPTFTEITSGPNKGKIRVVADGYYMGPAGP